MIFESFIEILRNNTFYISVYSQNRIFLHCPRFPYKHKEGRIRDKIPRYVHGITNASTVKHLFQLDHLMFCNQDFT